MKILYRTLLLSLSIMPLGLQAQQYVGDPYSVPLRSGPGTEYRIVHQGIPNGTALTVEERTESGEYSKITTAGGSKGWIRSQYLSAELPAKQKISKLEQTNSALSKTLQKTKSQLLESQGNYKSISEKFADTQADLVAHSSELTEIKRISASAIDLDKDNQRLLEEGAVLRSKMELLEAENMRLQESSEGDAFINGALAVLLGVIITLLVPRFWPQRRRSSSWA